MGQNHQTFSHYYNLRKRRFGLPQISNIRDLTNYLEYFSSSTISDLEYTESITWFSRIIHSTYLQKAETQDIFTEIINKLHLILRPQNNDRLCIAFKHKKSCESLIKDFLCLKAMHNLSLFCGRSIKCNLFIISVNMSCVSAFCR